MSENHPPSLDAWRKLYEAAVQVKQLAPWKWMTEADVFGVENPASGELGFVSVMGLRREYLAVAVYRGAEGLYGFLYSHDERSPFNPDRIFEVPQIQAAFTDRQFLRREDLDIIRQLGLKFRGRDAWPVFRSTVPGYQPWFLEPDEVEFLTHALEQTVAMGQRFHSNSSMFSFPRKDQYLVRIQTEPSGWEDQIMQVPQPPDTPLQIMMDVPLLERVRLLPHSAASVEIDLFLVPMPVGEEGERPRFPYLLMTVDPISGLILGQEMLHPITTLESMWELVPWKVITVFSRLGFIPYKVMARSPILLQLLMDFSDDLDFRLEQREDLPGIDGAKALMSHLLNSPF